MVNRPKLNELRKDDQVLRNEINKVSKRVSKETLIIFVLWSVCFFIYLMGYVNYYYLNELFFLVGIPLFFILGAIGLVLIQIFQKAQFDISLGEYDSRHILHRLEEIHDTLIEMKESSRKDDY